MSRSTTHSTLTAPNTTSTPTTAHDDDNSAGIRSLIVLVITFCLVLLLTAVVSVFKAIQSNTHLINGF